MQDMYVARTKFKKFVFHKLESSDCKLFKHKSTVTAVIKQTSIFYRFPDAKNNRFLTNQGACNISIYYFINMYHQAVHG